MPSLKEYVKKISSLENTKKVTQTMKMVATSKLKKNQILQENSKPYYNYLTEVISRLLNTKLEHSLLKKYDSNKILLLVIAADKGLCGGFNNNLLKKTFSWTNQQKKDIDIISYGKKASDFFSSRGKLIKSHSYASEINFQITNSIGLELIQHFFSGTYSDVYIASNQFVSTLSQVPIIKKVLPIDLSAIKKEIKNKSTKNAIYTYYPNKKMILENLIDKFFSYSIFRSFLESYTGEQASRMTAMENASSNASSLIDDYTLLKNRARQSSITTELTEIVSGAESLK